MKYYAIDHPVSLSKIEDVATLRSAIHLNEPVPLFKSLEDAVTFTKENADEGKDQVYPIFEVSFSGIKGRQSTDFGTVQGFIATPNETKQFKLERILLDHLDPKFNNVDLTVVEATKEAGNSSDKAIVISDDKKQEIPAISDDKKEEAAVKADDKKEEAAVKADDKKEEAAVKADDKKEEKAEDTEDASYSTAMTFAVSTTLGTVGFWLANLYPHAIAQLANVGLALPAASLAVQIALPIAFGLAFASMVGVISYGFNRLFNNSTATDARTEDQKYHDELKATEEKIKTTSEKFTSDKDKDFLSEFAKVMDLEHTAERTFETNGDLTKKQPEATDKLIVLQYEAAKLADVAALEGDARIAKEAQALEAAKVDAAKKFAIN